MLAGFKYISFFCFFLGRSGRVTFWSCERSCSLLMLNTHFLRAAKGTTHFVVRTDMLSRGVDIPNLTMVVNYQPPDPPGKRKPFFFSIEFRKNKQKTLLSFAHTLPSRSAEIDPLQPTPPKSYQLPPSMRSYRACGEYWSRGQLHSSR